MDNELKKIVFENGDEFIRKNNKKSKKKQKDKLFDMEKTENAENHEKRRKIFTNTEIWETVKKKYGSMTFENQIEILNCPTVNTEETTLEFVLLKKQINEKINGYKNQDIKKNLFSPDKFVDFDFILNLLKSSNLICFYCKEPVIILYENVREPKQWTLERVNNSFGHNRDNLVLSCLCCNLKRRCMFQERYIFTKQMKIIKTG